MHDVATIKNLVECTLTNGDFSLCLVHSMKDLHSELVSIVNALTLDYLGKATFTDQVLSQSTFTCEISGRELNWLVVLIQVLYDSWSPIVLNQVFNLVLIAKPCLELFSFAQKDPQAF